MPRTRASYSAEFRQQIIELARAGRTPHDLTAHSGVSGR